jgi:hypothetical protein
MSNTELPEEDNVEVAMNKVAETMEFTVSTNLGEDGPSNKQIIVRTTDGDHERWKMAAQKEGKSMSQFIRDVVNEKVVDVLDCAHPIELRRYYPWAEFCLKCNSRLSESNKNKKHQPKGINYAKAPRQKQ